MPTSLAGSAAPPPPAAATRKNTSMNTRRSPGGSFMPNILSREGAERHIRPVVGAEERAILLVRGVRRPPERRACGHEAGAPHPAGLLRRLSRQGGGGNPGAGPALPLR